ncbi:MAG: hypothetical protein ACYCOU_03035 [Sulfobacillus sp.]
MHHRAKAHEPEIAEGLSHIAQKHFNMHPDTAKKAGSIAAGVFTSLVHGLHQAASRKCCPCPQDGGHGQVRPSPSPSKSRSDGVVRATNIIQRFLEIKLTPKRRQALSEYLNYLEGQGVNIVELAKSGKYLTGRSPIYENLRHLLLGTWNAGRTF